MATAALKQDALLPQAAGGNAPGAALALLVHAGLLAALTFGVDWRTHAPDVVAAELWAAVPQTAAAPPPPPPEPTPAPTPAPQPVPAPPPPAKAEAPAPAPDITIERERKKAQEAERQRAAEQKKADDERKQREKAEAAKAAKAEQTAKAEQERVEKQREENLRRMMAQAGDGAGVAPKGNAATTAAPSATYAGKVRAAIRPHIVFTERLTTSSAAEVEVNAAPGGSIISRKLVKSSGSREWDDAVLRAIDKTATLPRDTDGRVPATLIITFRPSD